MRYSRGMSFNARTALLAVLLVGCGRVGFPSMGEASEQEGGSLDATGAGNSETEQSANGIDSGACVPTGDGTLEDPRVLCDTGGFLRIADDLAGHYRLGADVVLGSVQPIGFYTIDDPDSALPFTGTFDGGGFTIRGGVIDSTSGPEASALFAHTNGATIRNVTLSDVTAAGAFHAAGLIGYAVNTDIADVTLTGVHINPDAATTDSLFRAAALVAEFSVSGSAHSIRNVSIDATLMGSDLLGGLVGMTQIALGGSIEITDTDVTITITQTDRGNTMGGLLSYLRVRDEDPAFTMRNVAVNTNITMDGSPGGSWSGGVLGTLDIRDAPRLMVTLDNVDLSGTLQSSADFNSNGNLGGFFGSVSNRDSEGVRFALTRLTSDFRIEILSNSVSINSNLGGVFGAYGERDTTAGTILSIENSALQTTFSSPNDNTVRRVAGVFADLTGNGAGLPTVVVRQSRIRVRETLPASLLSGAALVGTTNVGAALTFDRVYFNGDARLSSSDPDSRAGATALNDAQYLDPQAYVGWDFESVWQHEIGAPPGLR